jgi:hypothetical protein
MTDVNDRTALEVKPPKGMVRQLLPVAEQDPERLYRYGIESLEDFDAEADPTAALARAAGAQAWFLAALARSDQHIAGRREQQARCVVSSGEVFGDTADEIEAAAAALARQVAGVGPRVPVRPDGPYNLNQVPPDPSQLADTDRNRDLRRRACGKELWARIAMVVYREAEEG